MTGPALGRAEDDAGPPTLGEMAAHLAHELGQPAATMCLAAANAARALRHRGGAAVPGALARLDRIAAQGERLGALMQHLKAVTQAGALVPGPVSVAAAVEAALVLTGAGLRQDGAALEQAIEPGLPMVVGQFVPLTHVLAILLRNARDAMLRQPPGHPRRIRLRAAVRGGDRVAIEVADSGGGFAPAVLARLFVPGLAAGSLGEGLGLWVSHGLVHRMRGSIAAANDVEGAVLTVTLACMPGQARPGDDGGRRHGDAGCLGA